MQLKQHITGSRTRQITAVWCELKVGVMMEKLREARHAKGESCTCFWCHRALVDGDLLAVAELEYVGHRILCHDCGQALIATAGVTV